MKNYRFFLMLLGVIFVVWTIWVGYTWHLIPTYLCVLLILLLVSVAKKINRKVLVTTMLLILPALSILFLYLFPFVTLPQPSGSYAVGVTYMKVDTDRDEIFTEDESDKRSLYLKIWYPAQAGENYNPYFEEGDKAVAILLEPDNIPPFLFKQLAVTKTNSFTNAAVAEGRFPLLTFSHGWGSWFGQNTVLMEELASQGYIVASIAHSHQAMFAAANDKALVTYPRIAPAEQNIDSSLHHLAYRIFVEKSAVERDEFDGYFSKVVSASEGANKSAMVWADDIISTIDFMLHEGESDQSFFYNHIDTRQLGSLGMSLGGAASVEAALRDQRILAAINMDGIQFGTLINDTISTPVLFLESQKSLQKFSMFSSFFGRSKSDVHCLLFNKAEHANFSDMALYSPALKWAGMVGDLDGAAMINSMNSIVPDYFNSVFSNSKFQIEKHIRSGEIEEPVY